MPNPTDTAHALVEKLEFSVRDLCYEEDRRTQRPANLKACKTEVDDARAALLAHVAGVEQERDALVRAIDEEMTSAHIGVFNTGDDVKKALAMLGQWHWEAGEYFAKNPEATRPTEARDEK